MGQLREALGSLRLEALRDGAGSDGLSPRRTAVTNSCTGNRRRTRHNRRIITRWKAPAAAGIKNCHPGSRAAVIRDPFLRSRNLQNGSRLAQRLAGMTNASAIQA